MRTALITAVDEGPMSRFQWSAVAVCVVLNMLDGFDVLVMAFTATAVSSEWALSGSQLGLLLSAGLFGMAGGSLLIAPWADRLGRRPIILGCLLLAGTGMVLSSVSQSAAQLGALRAVTGLGIGGILASSNVIASEYSSARWRGLAVSLNSTGYALGATVGGVIAVALLSSSGWRSVFLFGGIATFTAIPLVFFRLPESLDFLLTRRPANALARVNSLARRLGHEPISALPEHAAPTRRRGAGHLRQLFTPEFLRPTLLVWTAFFFVMFGFYFVTSWTPRLLTEAGMSASEGVTGGVLLNLGGIFGAAVLGALAARFALRNVLVVYLVASALLLTTFALSTSSLAVAFSLGGLIGLFANGCVAGLYAIMPTIYDTSIRATGVGWAIGVGRVGAILSPLVAGALIDVDWTPTHLFVAFGATFLLAALAVLLMRPARSTVAAGTETQPFPERVHSVQT